MFVALLQGFGQGLFATLLSTAFVDYFFLEPPHSFALQSARDIVGLMLFATMGITMSWLGDLFRRRAKRLKEFEKAVEGLEEMVAVVNRDYRYMIANQAFLACRGIKQEHLIGRTIDEILSPGMFETIIKKHLDESFQGKTVQYEMKYTYPGRGERQLFVSYFPIEGPGGIDRVACVLRDVTDQKRAEHALKLFRTLIDECSDAVEVLDPETLRFLDVNEKACKDLGYTREELLSLTVYDIDSSADIARHSSVLTNLRKAGFVIRETVHRRKDGSTFSVETSLKYVQLDRSYVVAVSRDISDRKKAEGALRESEDRYRDLVENSQDLVCTHDLGGILLSLNPGPARLLGYEVDELLTTPMREIVAPEFREQFDAYLKRIGENGADSGVMCVLARDGTRRIWEYNNTLRTEGVASPIVRGMARDVTDRLRAQSALRSSEQRYRLLFEKTVAGVGIISIDGRLIDCNDAWARIFGYANAQECRDSQIGFHYPDPVEREKLLNELKEVGAFFDRELQLRRKDGVPFWILLNSTLVKDGVTEPLIQSTVFDITKRKEAEEALSNSEQRYRLLFEKTVAGVGIVGIEGEVVDCNDAWAHMFGYRDATECRGTKVAQHYFDSTQRESLLAELLHKGSVTDRELHLMRKDGTPFWILVNDILLPDGQNSRLIQATVMDITARKEAEAALRRREEDYRRFVSQSSEGIFRQDLDEPIPLDLPEDEIIQRILHGSHLAECNEAIAEMYGLTVADFIGRRMTETLDPSDPRNIELTRDYVRSGFRVVERESHETDIHGNPKVFLNSMIGIVENGMLLRTWGIQRDVTERAKLEEARSKAEKELQASEAHFRILVEQASDGIFISDARGKYLDVNSAGAEMLGYTREEILQLSIPDVIITDDTPRVNPEVARFSEGLIVRSEWTFRRKDGSLFPGEVAGKQLPDGRLQGILRDMSERRRVEEEMRRNEERFRVSLKDSPITVFNQDCDLRYTWIYNPHLYWENEAVGRTDEELIGSKKAAHLVELKRRVLKTGRALREEVVVTFEGRNHAFDLTIEPLFGEGGSIVGITGASVDIARLREMTDRLQDAKDKLAHEKSYLENEIQKELGFEEIIGRSPALSEVLKQARVVAPTDSTVLLLGETGTGKELVARSVHSLSSRRDKNFIKLNCAAVPSGLLESELFGHEKGAFTSAANQKVGRIELADGGTLFLDEVGELPLDLQPKLLRVLQDREFERLGGIRTLHVDVRIISATNRDLHQDIADKKFREDLFYRLNVFPIDLPPLRERRGDIPILVHHFVHKHSTRMGKHIDTVPEESMVVLQNWSWPGNIRELENMIERMVILTKGHVLSAPPAELVAPPETTEDNLTEMEREHIIRVLRDTRGVLSGDDGAASRLGVKRTTLQSMLKRFGIEPHSYRRGTGTFGGE
jgi:PAS domain S-box-containing protein